MKQMLNLAAISVALTVNFGAAYAQNMPTPKPEDAGRSAFQTPTDGNNAPAPAENSKDRPTSGEPDERQSPIARTGWRAEYVAEVGPVRRPSCDSLARSARRL
jgi:hypothetical protein